MVCRRLVVVGFAAVVGLICSAAPVARATSFTFAPTPVYETNEVILNAFFDQVGFTPYLAGATVAWGPSTTFETANYSSSGLWASSSHTYDLPGTYTVTVVGDVRYNDGGRPSHWYPIRQTIFASLDVWNTNPLIDSVAGALDVMEGNDFNFFATASDPGNTADDLTYRWDLDADGQYDDYTGRNAVFKLAAGTHAVGLQVYDNEGGMGILGGDGYVCQTFNVTVQAPVTDPSAVPLSSAALSTAMGMMLLVAWPAARKLRR